MFMSDADVNNEDDNKLKSKFYFQENLLTFKHSSMKIE